MLGEEDKRSAVEFFEELIVIINKLKGFKEMVHKACDARLEELYYALARLAGVNVVETDLTIDDLQSLFVQANLPTVNDIEYLCCYASEGFISENTFTWLLATVDMERHYASAPAYQRPPVDAKACLAAFHLFVLNCIQFIKDLAKLRQE